MRGSGRWLGLLALFSIVIGRGLSVALPGSRAGIRDWITVIRTAGAILSQVAVVAGAAVAIGLLGAVLWRRTFPTAYRLCVLPAGAAVVTVVALSTRGRLGLSETIVLGVSAIVVALASATLTLGPAKSRGVGLVLSAAAVAATCSLAARVLNQDGELGPGFAARHLATAGFAFDIASLITATAWLAARRPRTMMPVIGGIIAAAALLSWGAAVGSSDGASLWQVLASRTLSEWTQYPAPVVETPARHWVEAYALLLAFVAAVVRRRTAALEASLTLILAARASVDVPLCALFLSLGALMAPFDSNE